MGRGSAVREGRPARTAPQSLEGSCSGPICQDSAATVHIVRSAPESPCDTPAGLAPLTVGWPDTQRLAPLSQSHRAPEQNVRVALGVQTILGQMYRLGPGCEHGQTVVGPSLAHSELYSAVIALSLRDREYVCTFITKGEHRVRYRLGTVTVC